MSDTPLRERRRRDTEIEIERAALQLISERGFERMTMDEVAGVAGVSTRTVFRYFPAKIDLVFGRIRRIDDALRSTIEVTESLTQMEDRIEGKLEQMLTNAEVTDHLVRVHRLLRVDKELRGSAASAGASVGATPGAATLQQRLTVEIAASTLRAAFASWADADAEATPESLLLTYRAARQLRQNLV